ncbi:MAG TPA: hypothetical protein VF796_21325 [Humisphaera sp.]
MDKFVGFTYLLLDVSPGAARAPAPPRPHRERVDVAARQFRAALQEGGAADDGAAGGRPRNMMLTHDFKVRTRSTPAGGWVSFHVDRGDGTVERLEEVAVIAFARDPAGDAEVRRAVGRVAPGAVDGLPPLAPPYAVGVRLTRDVPPVVSEFMPRAAAGFLADDV